MSVKPRITIERLKQVLGYNPETGVFRWLVANNACRPDQIGKVAGGKYVDGHTCYLQVMIDRVCYRQHMLAWFYMTGKWPLQFVDHKDLNGLNNRWNNLRLATVSQSNANRRVQVVSKTGLKGVSISTIRGKQYYRARIRMNGKRVFLGCFLNPQEAHKAYMFAARSHYGEYARG